MGLQLIVKNADFSAIRVGRLGLYTSITDGLVGLFGLTSLLADPAINFANYAAPATIVGSPVQALTGVTSGASDYIDFGIVATGARTVAVVVKNDISGVPYFSSFAAAPTYGEYIWSQGTDLRFESAKWATPHPSVASSVRDEMVAARIELGVGGSIYKPRTATLSSKADTGEQDWLTTYRTSVSSAGSATTKAQLFAYWNRTLTTGELDTFYGEMQAQLLALGIATI